LLTGVSSVLDLAHPAHLLVVVTVLHPTHAVRHPAHAVAHSPQSVPRGLVAALHHPAADVVPPQLHLEAAEIEIPPLVVVDVIPHLIEVEEVVTVILPLLRDGTVIRPHLVVIVMLEAILATGTMKRIKEEANLVFQVQAGLLPATVAVAVGAELARLLQGKNNHVVEEEVHLIHTHRLVPDRDHVRLLRQGEIGLMTVINVDPHLGGEIVPVPVQASQAVKATVL